MNYRTLLTAAFFACALTACSTSLSTDAFVDATLRQNPPPPPPKPVAPVAEEGATAPASVPPAGPATHQPSVAITERGEKH